MQDMDIYMPNKYSIENIDNVEDINEEIHGTDEKSTDSVRLEGVFRKGYGYLPKMVMYDPDLTIEAKAIYALFCSYAGAGEDADMPPVAVIRERLGIGKITYSRHFNMLLENGYILAEQTRGTNASNTSYFTKNTYTIVKFPKKYESNRPDGQYKKEYADIRTRHNLIGAGYGLIPKLPLLSDIPIAVKGLYSYLICFATHEEPVVWPSYEMIQRHLNLSENTVTKYLNLLVKTPFVRKLQRERNGGQFGAAKYEIQFALQADNVTEPSTKILTPEPHPKNYTPEPHPKNYTPEPHPKNYTPEPHLKNYTPEPHPKKPSTEKPSTEKPSTENDTPIYNTNIDNTTLYKTIYQSEREKKFFDDIGADESDQDKIDGLMEQKSIPEEEWEWGEIISKESNIPKHMLYDEEALDAAIKYLCDFEFLRQPSFFQSKDNGLTRKIAYCFINALRDLLSPETNGRFSAMKAWEMLPLVMDFGTTMNGFQYASLSEFRDNCIDSYERAIDARPIENPKEYMKSIIWNALQDGGLGFDSKYTSGMP